MRVQSGGRLSTCANDTNPCRAAFISYEGGPNKSRFSWDPLNTLTAVRGPEAGHCQECTHCDGANDVTPEHGNNHWIKGPRTNQSYLILSDPKAAGEAIDDLLCQPPKNSKHF